MYTIFLQGLLFGLAYVMPIGMQFVGAMFSEVALLRAAQSWEEDHPGCGIPLAEDDLGGAQ